MADANKLNTQSSPASGQIFDSAQSPASASSPSSSATQSQSSRSASSNPKANSTNSSTASSPPTVSDSDKQRAASDIEAIHSDLEAYQTQNGYYPSDINYSNFSSFGADQNAFTPPPGVHFVYAPSPNGCTTAAQNCQHFTLDALDANNNPVAPEQTSFN